MRADFSHLQQHRQTTHETSEEEIIPCERNEKKRCIPPKGKVTSIPEPGHEAPSVMHGYGTVAA